MQIKRPGQYIYTYDYELNEDWLRTPDNTVSAADIWADEKDELSFYAERANEYLKCEAVEQEVVNTADTIHGKLNSENDMSSKVVFTLLSDTHYVRNGIWECTAATIEAVNKRLWDEYRIKPDGIIHLGDFTDGILSGDICRKYSRRTIDRMINWGASVYPVMGNHDANYFRQNPEIMSEEEQYNLYLRDIISDDTNISLSAACKLCYKVYLEEKNLTLFVLSAYDNSELNRYGFSSEQLKWVKSELEAISGEHSNTSKILILSHDAPLTELDFWAKEIRNGSELCNILDEWNSQNENRIVGFLHGHTHADYICDKRSFPIISIGCSKLEYFEAKKPAGAIAYARYENEITQELWDTLIIDTQTGNLEFIRFGAGQDRSVRGRNGNKMSDTFIDKKPLVWAHRGASGYAPENTLCSFELAAKMGAAGVELDVQYTKDRQIVVIHDEKIDRVSSGKGLVVDHTLEQLKRYNFNNTHPEFPYCEIPTFEEVLKLLEPTGLTINVELKTGINFYPGIEKDTIELVEKYGMKDRVIYSSFNHESVMRVKEICPEAQCGFLYSDGIASIPDYAATNGVEAIHPSVNNMKYPGLVEGCRKKGLKIHVWTANKDDVIEQMRQYGVDATITNFPDVALKIYGAPKPDFDYETWKKETIAAQKMLLKEKGKSNKDLSKNANAGIKKKVLHAAGTTYAVVRKPFVALDKKVQKMSKASKQ